MPKNKASSVSNYERRTYDNKKERTALKAFGGQIALPDINPLNSQPYSEFFKNEKYAQVQKLPMSQPETIKKLQHSFSKYQVTLLTAETGAGKSTLIGFHLLTYLRKVYGLQSKIWITQPRRLAAMNVAEGTAEAMDVELGKEVGYRIGGLQNMDESTKILFVTEAILFKAYVNDPDISNINAVIIDEAHERGLDTDLVLLFTKLAVISKHRPDLKVIVMSATANINLFTTYFAGCNLVQVGGVAFPVKDIYLQKNPRDYVTAAVNKIIDICKVSKDGDILVFFASKLDNSKGCALLQEKYQNIKGSFKAYEFSSDTIRSDNKEVKDEITRQSASSLGVDRKIIFSTNVAEASVTIDGIVFVIDSGRAQISGFDFKNGVSILKPEWIAKANARQRRGRSGRTRAGECHRLYTEKQYEQLEDFERPAITRTDLTEKLLEVFAMKTYSNANDLWSLTQKMITIPPSQSMRYTFEKFATLGIMDSVGDITTCGKRIADLQPISVELGRAMMFANDYGCRMEMCELAAVIKSYPRLLKDLVTDSKQIDKRLIDPDGEIFTLLRIIRTARNLGKETTHLTKFCVGYGLKITALNKIIDDYHEFRSNFERLFEILPPQHYVLGEPLQIEIPYFKLYRNISWQWKTTNISGAIRERIIRCLLHGFFLNSVGHISRDSNSLLTLSKGLKVAGKIHNKIAFYFAINAPRFGKDQYTVTALTEVKNYLWFSDAARHYIPFIKNKI